MPVSGTVLGLGCGQPRGSAEILLKAALRAAEAEGAQVELVRLDELGCPAAPPRRPSRTTRGGCGSGSSSATG